jgi:molecular chaperone GrpE
MTRIPIEDENDTRGRGPVDMDAGDADPVEAPQGRGGSAAGAGEDAQKLRAERDDLYERFARAVADAKNTQKRIQAEADQRVQYANQSLIKTLLPVIDNFERALAVDPDKVDARSILKGMQIVHDQWLSVLKGQQVEEIAPTPGTPFDPTRHEALMQQDAPQYAGKGPTVVNTLQKGYGLQGRTLRPAQVAVSRTS